jgi:iron complex transport system substrate-binding protein
MQPRYAKGFSAERRPDGVSILTVRNPWPGASREFRYALVPGQEVPRYAGMADSLDAVIGVPVERVVLTSTTHIPSLEALGLQERLVGFPGMDYVSSPLTRQRMADGLVEELGANEHLNTEKVLALQPDLVMGFGVSGIPRHYQAIQASGIPLVLNGDWMEEDPLGKAEWILLFGLLFGREQEAEKVFKTIETEYLEARRLASGSENMPTVLSGSLYRDVWYLPGGNSWAASFIRDSHARYLWGDTGERGSLSLSLEAVLERATEAEFWIAPSQFVSYGEMAAANPHYQQFRAFRERKVLTYARSLGPGKGMLYFELGPNRPDLVLKDLIYWFHPGLLPDYEPVFFKPLTE